MRSFLATCLLLLSFSVYAASIQFPPEACGPMAYSLITVMTSEVSKEDQIKAVLLEKAPKAQEEFWLQLLDMMFDRRGTPEEFAVAFYTTCTTNKGFVDLGDKI